MANLNEPRKCNENLNGVSCEVTGCAYHGGNNCCFADSIKVLDPTANRKSETFCSTFKSQKSQNTMK